MRLKNYKAQLYGKLAHYNKEWPKSWIDNLETEYHEKITSKLGNNFLNKPWFVDPNTRLGNYDKDKRNDRYIHPQVSDYFNRLLYGSNIFAIDYLSENIDDIKRLNFCDAGCGFGLLSFFLKKMNIDCYNYDNFSQLGPEQKFNLKNNKIYRDYEVMAPTSTYPDLDRKQVDILYCADVTTNMRPIIESMPKILMIEHWYTEIGNMTIDSTFSGLDRFYNLDKDYGPMMRVWKLKHDL